ncbi:hypothetical protein BMF94_4065 [Rhodotorula taiwanensis]|uniref:Vacuolar protein-sorting-associated protein 36 n=1 Tax=Rhodotorula taiwanensis TaxID=741276 RepID=A0A2S5B7Z4_9BASI|nr:hypothetical protein BMF94_4065 [Rhodotorula taiwanensis]
MNRFNPLDVTLESLSVQLYPDECILIHADGVGLYDGYIRIPVTYTPVDNKKRNAYRKEKAPRYDDGRAVLTSHRIVFISSSKPHSNSAALDLAHVKQTEYWVGFLKSHPKITLVLSDPSAEESGSTNLAASKDPSKPANADAARDKNRERLALVAAAGGRAWVCTICGMRNVPSIELGLKCSLCGVARDPLPPTQSNPPSRLGTPRSVSPPRRPSSFSSASKPAAVGTTPTPLDPKETGFRIACPVCTFLNHHSMATCEVCESPLFPDGAAPPRASALQNSSVSAPPTRSSTPGLTTDPASAIPSPSGSLFVRLSFRRGGEKVYYAALKEALARKAWDLSAAPAKDGRRSTGSEPRKSTSGTNDAGSTPASSGVGIDAIMRGMDLDSRDRGDSLDDALKDLDSLMAKAKDMISLAQSINGRLASAMSTEAPTTDEERQAISLASTSLQSLGLVSAAVTPDLVSDAKRYHQELAKELAEVLRKGRVMEKHGGIVGLDEVWCLWNRARGVALVSPKDLRLAAPYLPTYSLTTAASVRLRVFPSGLTILHTPRFSLATFSARIYELLDLREAVVASLSEAEAAGMGEMERREREGVNVLEVAQAEKLSVGLAKEMMDLLEMGEGPTDAQRRGGGQVVRDDQGGDGTRWFRNLISNSTWDGQTF